MVVLKLGGKMLGGGTRSPVHDHHQRAAPYTLVVGVLHGTKDKRASRLTSECFRIGRGQEAGREESIAEEGARGMLALPERGGIARRLGFLLSLFDQFNEMSEELLVLTAGRGEESQK